jgi:hypothetical protein
MPAIHQVYVLGDRFDSLGKSWEPLEDHLLGIRQQISLLRRKGCYNQTKSIVYPLSIYAIQYTNWNIYHKRYFFFGKEKIWTCWRFLVWCDAVVLVSGAHASHGAWICEHGACILCEWKLLLCLPIVIIGDISVMDVQDIHVG